MVEKGKMAPAERHLILGRVESTVDLEKASSCDLVIEAIVENLKAKANLNLIKSARHGPSLPLIHRRS